MICNFYNKPFIYCCNVDENQLIESNKQVRKVEEYAIENTLAIKVCAKMEEELRDLNEEDRKDYLNEYNLTSSGLDRIIRIGYDSLGLISYFTQEPKESRAWTVKKAICTNCSWCDSYRF